MATLLCAAVLSACAGAPEVEPSAPHTSSFAAQNSPSYQLQAEDKLKLLVFGEEAISGDYTVSKDGFVNVAQVGNVKAVGLTTEELQEKIADKLRNGIVENPQVSVLLNQEE